LVFGTAAFDSKGKGSCVVYKATALNQQTVQGTNAEGMCWVKKGEAVPAYHAVAPGRGTAHDPLAIVERSHTVSDNIWLEENA
jgi:hypothetical protein